MSSASLEPAPVAPNWAVKVSSRAVTELYSSNSSASGSDSSESELDAEL